MKKTFLFLLLSLFNFLNAQNPRSGGINNIQSTVLNTVHDNFVGVQTTNQNAFAVYNFSTNFNYYLGLKNTDNIAEGLTNKYFSNTLARNAFSAGSGLSGGTITSSGTISMPNTGTAGTYNTVITDAQGRVVSGFSATPSSVTRNITGTSFQVSTSQSSRVKYTVTHTVALTLLLSSGSSMAYLETSPNNSTWTLVDQAGFSRVLTVAVALNDSMTNNVSAEVPAGHYVRIRTVTSGGGSASYTCGQETIF